MDQGHRTRVRGAVRALVVTTVGLVASVGLATVSAMPASAVCEINPAQSGAVTGASTSIFGASAKITYQNPTVCNQAGRSSSAWSMVSAPNNGQPNGPHNWYFQVGFKKLAGGAPVKWAQWTKDCYPNCGTASVHQNWYGAGTSTTNTYAVYLVASTQRLRATIEGADIGAGPTYNPANYWDANWRANYSGETQDRNSKIPGVVTNKVQFNNIMRYNSDGSITFVGSFADSGVKCGPTPCPQYHYNSYSPPSGGLGFRIWSD